MRASVALLGAVLAAVACTGVLAQTDYEPTTVMRLNSSDDVMPSTTMVFWGETNSTDLPSPTHGAKDLISNTTTSRTTVNHRTTEASAIDMPACPALENGDSLTQSEIVKRMVADCRYDKLLRPGGNDRLVVHVRNYIYFIQPAEAHDLQFKLHFLLQLRYTDERLSYRHYSPERRRIIGEDQLRSLIWVPHIFLSNEQSSSIMGTDSKDVLISISPDGEVIFSRRIQAVLYCWLNLQKFPFDEQLCSMNFETWMYNVSEMKLKWEKEVPVKLATDLHLTEYSLLAEWTNETTDFGDLYDPRHGGFVGNYSTLLFTFKLAREVGYYLMDYFIPSIMIVSISWVTFWLQADQSAPRIMLGTSTMLSFITLAASQGKTLPKVSYIKASEIWFLGCTGFIFGTLVEFAFVNTIWRRKKNVELKKVNSKYILKSTLTPRLARKEFQKEFQGLHKSHSCSSLDGEPDNKPVKPNNNFNNYLTVHSFPSQLNLPTITTQSFDDLIPADQPNSCPSGASSRNPVAGGDGAETTRPKGWTTMTPQEISMWIDTRSRFVFPLAFLIFNAIYWTFVYYW